MKLKNQIFALSAIVGVILFFACKKESGSSTLMVRLTDAPAAYEEVNIDLERVTVKLANDSAGWVELAAVPGIYNLLALQNGIDTLIGTINLPTTTVKEIRLILGADNSIKVGGNVYPLTIPSGSESGLKIKINKNLSAPIETLIIDFDAALSVHQTGNGEYKLKPVLKIK